MEHIREKRLLAAKIRSARAERGISQRQFALMTGISRSYLWKIEAGTADTGIDLLCEIARALDMQVHELIDF